MGEQTRFSDLMAQRQGTDGVQTVLGKKIVIVGLSMEQGNNGQLLVMTLDDGKRIRTGGAVLIKKAEQIMKPRIDSGSKIETTIVSKRGKMGHTYYDFE